MSDVVAEKLLKDARDIIYVFASKNPRFYFRDQMHDPCGSHEWLRQFNEYENLRLARLGLAAERGDGKQERNEG